MAEFRSNHFVPRSYLKRWSHPIPWKSKGQMIWMQQKVKGKPTEVPLDNQCQKDNLYKIPDDFDFEDKKALEKHWFGFSDELYAKSMDNTLDQAKLPENFKDLGNIVLHVIWQSYRTPKFKKETERKINELKIENPELDDSRLDFVYQLSYLMVKTFPIFQREVIPELIFSPKGMWFITSDNPSTFWLNTWNSKKHLPTILGTDFRTSNLGILCPLNPQCCIILRLNQIKRNKRYLGINRYCKPDEVYRINQSIYYSADKTIYSLDRKTLENI